MKVLIVNFSDADGGAARASLRLHLSLTAAGVDSVMVVCKKETGLASVIGPTSKYMKGLNQLRPSVDQIPLLRYKPKPGQLFSPSILPGLQIEKLIAKLNPDILHLHWVSGGMFRPEQLANVQIPIFWSLHDMWPFTGGCHYSDTCDKFKDSCGSCPVLGSKAHKDLSSAVQKRKQKAYGAKNNITVVGLSAWLAGLAKESSIFRNTNVVNLPNPIDSKMFSPFSKSHARELLGLSEDKKLMLFGAMSSTQDLRKGWLELRSALDLLDLDDVEVVIFGSNQDQDKYEYPYPVTFMGTFRDDLSLKILYSACDVMVVPSLQENLANTIMEALACGLPVVGFDIGGNSDMVGHKLNGYLAEPLSVSDLAFGIRWVLCNDDYSLLSQAARTVVLEKFDSKKVAFQYVELYQRALKALVEDGH
jgi:glycosyltransferase involved in cell wall biosynthesis